jgi:hypothetical protein
VTSSAEARLAEACARARELIDEYEARASRPGACPRSTARELEELRTRIDGTLRHAGRAALELASEELPVTERPRRAA